MAGVEALHRRGINVILIAHSIDKTAKDGDYKTSRIDMLEFGNWSVHNLMFARADWAYYMTSECQTTRETNRFGASKTVPIYGGQPKINVYTRRTNSFEAKIRTGKIENVPDMYEIDISDPLTSKVIFEDLEK